MSEKKLIGKVIWFDSKRGYGFVARDGEEDLFIHFSDIESEGFKTLYKGQTISFNLGANKRNQPKAINVTVLNN